MFVSRGKMFMMALTLLGIVTSLHWPAVVQGGGGGERCSGIVEKIVEDVGIMIKIKPGAEEDEDPPSINPHSHGKIRVAVLSTNDFDATRIDPVTAYFGLGMAESIHSAEKDVNDDGLFDLLLKFRTRDIDIQCGDTSAELTAKTFPMFNMSDPDGPCVVEVLTRSDTFRTVGCSRKKTHR